MGRRYQVGDIVRLDDVYPGLEEDYPGLSKRTAVVIQVLRGLYRIEFKPPVISSSNPSLTPITSTYKMASSIRLVRRGTVEERLQLKYVNVVEGEE